MSFFRDIGGGIKDFFTYEGSTPEEVRGTLRGLKRFLNPKTWQYVVGLRETSPYAPPDPWDVDLDKVRTPEEARDAIDSLLGTDPSYRKEAEAIFRMRDEGGTARFVSVLQEYGFTGELGGMPFSPEGDAMLATGNFTTDPITIMNQDLSERIAGDERLALQYMRLNDPLELLPALVAIERDLERVGNEKGNNFLDALGRPFAAVKDIGAALLFGESWERVEEQLGDAFYMNAIPDPYLRQVMAKRLYDYNVFEFWDQDHEHEREAIQEAERLMAMEGLTSQGRAEQFESYLRDNNLGAAGTFSNLMGQIIADPLWLVGGAVRLGVGVPLKAAGITLPRVGAVSRLITPTGRTIAFDKKGVAGLLNLAGYKALVNMPELAYQQKKAVEPVKGLTRVLFERPANLQGSAIRTRLEERLAGVAHHFVGRPELLDDLSRTFLTGKPTRWVEENLPGLLDDPRLASLAGQASKNQQEIWQKTRENLTDFLAGARESNVWRPGLTQEQAIQALQAGEKVLPPNTVRDMIVQATAYAGRQVAEEAQQALWKATKGGRFLQKYAFPMASVVRGATAAITINNPGFIWLNMVSNSIRLMWHSAFHPGSGFSALARSYWLEAGTIARAGGRYPEVWERMLKPLGWTPLDVERNIARVTGTHDLLGRSLEDAARAPEFLLDDSFDLLQKAAVFPGKEIGARHRFWDKAMWPVYAAGRVDKATRRAFFMSNIQIQNHLGTAPGGAYRNLFGPMRDTLAAQGVGDDVVSQMENAFADEIRAYVYGTKELPAGKAALDEGVIRDALLEKIGHVEAGDASGLISMNDIARDFARTRMGLTEPRAEVFATKDLAEVIDWGNNEILPMLDAAQKAGTPEAFEEALTDIAKMVRQKGMEYDVPADIMHQLARHPDVIRGQTAYSKALRITSEAIRRDIVDQVQHLDRLMGVAKGTAWGSKRPLVWEDARRFSVLAKDATTENVRRLEQIKRVYGELASEVDQISSRTLLSTEMLDRVGLADDLRPAAAVVDDIVRVAQPELAFRSAPEGRFVYDPEVPLGEARSAVAAEADRLAIEKGKRVGITNVAQRRDWATNVARRDVLDAIASLRAEGLDDATILARLGQGRGLLAARSSRGSLRGLSDDVVSRRTGSMGVSDTQIQISAQIDVLDDFVAQARLPIGAVPPPVANIGGLGDDQLLPLLQRLRQATADDRAAILQRYPIEAEQIRLLQADDLAAKTKFPRASAAVEAEPSLAPLPAPPPPGDGMTVAQLWERYFTRRDTSQGTLYSWVEEMTGKSSVPHAQVTRQLRELTEKAFARHRELIDDALTTGTEDAWTAAGEQVRNLYQSTATRRGQIAGWGPNDLPQALDFNDPSGILAQEVQEFGEHLIASLRTKADQLMRGELAMEPENLRLLRGAANDVQAAWPETRDTIIANSRLATDFGMLNYLDQYGMDRIFQMVFPFEFWPTRDAMNWAIRGARAPGAFGALMILMFGSKDVAKQYGYPQRLQNRFPIPLPGLDDFMQRMPGLDRFMEDGDFAPTYFIDPMRFVFPYTFLRNAYDDEARRNTVAGRMLDVAQNMTPLNAGPFQTFVGRNTGLLDKDAWRSSYLSGGPFGVPMTATARATARFVFNGDTEAIPEEEQGLYIEKGHFGPAWLRDILGMNDDRFAVWRAERALASLVATGELIPGASKEEQLERAWVALDSHKGPEWKKAIRSSRSEQNLRRFTHWIGFPFGDLVGVNEGEMIWFGLKALYAEASRQGRLSDFYVKYPEFELRSAAVRGLSDPEEREKAIDTELYYKGVDKYVHEPFERAMMDMENERDRLRGMEQSEAVRDQLEIIETELRSIREEQATRYDLLDRAYPYREVELSLNRSPRERALRQARSAWYDIERGEGEDFDALLTRREEFLSQFPPVEDVLRHELDLWELEQEAILLKITTNRSRNQAFAQNDFERARLLADDRDAQLEELHARARGLLTRRDVERYLGSFAEPKTPEEREFESADAIFDLWMSLVSSGTPFTGREKAAISEYFRGLPEIQKFYPLSAVALEALTFDQRLAIMRRRDFWGTYFSIRDANTQLDYLRSMKPEMDRANALLGLPPLEILGIDPYPPEASGDPMFDHIRMMAALHRRRELEEDESLTPEERAELERLTAAIGDDPEDTAFTAEDVERYILPFSVEEELVSP